MSEVSREDRERKFCGSHLRMLHLQGVGLHLISGTLCGWNLRIAASPVSLPRNDGA
jgi:hypothetical protein